MPALRLMFVLLVAIWIGGRAPLSAGKWTKVQAANFTFIGDASEKTMRGIAQKLEQFREALGRAFGSAGVRAPAPTIVFVFANDRSFTPYKPKFQGKPVEVAGYFQGSENLNYIALNGEGREDDFGTIFHEYTHSIVSSTAGSLPAWLNEGLAEYYKTFEVRDGGKALLLGRADGDHLASLKATFMPLAELTAVQQMSKVYNEGDRRGIFYAESWAVVHYLLGNPARDGQLANYIRQLRAGTSPADAFPVAFKTDLQTFETELRTYLRRFTFPATLFTLDAKAAVVPIAAGVAISDSEAEASLADMVALMGRPDDARAQLQRIMKSEPSSALAQSALGTIELRAGHRDVGLPLVERAASLAPDDARIQVALGTALADGLTEARMNRATYPEALGRAQTVLTKAASLGPVPAGTLVDLAFVELEIRTNLDKARTLAEEAIKLAPARDGYRLMLAQVVMAQGEFDRATAILGPLVAAGSRPDIRDSARRLLGTVATLRENAAAAAQRAAQQAAAAGQRETAPNGIPPITTGAPSTTISSSASVPPAPTSTADAPPRTRLLLRTVQPGETRESGSLEAIECAGDVIAFRVNVRGTLLRVVAATFAQVDFVSYRNDPPPIACGPVRPAARVVVTFIAAPSGAGRAAANAPDGKAVALEMIPADYTD